MPKKSAGSAKTKRTKKATPKKRKKKEKWEKHPRIDHARNTTAVYYDVVEDENFGLLYLLPSANAWWLDLVKVGNLFSAYKLDSTDEEACSFAGISIDQLRYFKEKHDDFSRVKSICRGLPVLEARRTIIQSIKTVSGAQWYLERKRKKEFSTRVEFEHEGEIKHTHDVAPEAQSAINNIFGNFERKADQSEEKESQDVIE